VWKRVNVQQYANVLSKELSNITFPKSALTCDGSCRQYCTGTIDQYCHLVQCLINTSNSSVPIKNSRHEKQTTNVSLLIGCVLRTMRYICNHQVVPLTICIKQMGAIRLVLFTIKNSNCAKNIFDYR